MTYVPLERSTDLIYQSSYAFTKHIGCTLPFIACHYAFCVRRYSYGPDCWFRDDNNDTSDRNCHPCGSVHLPSQEIEKT